MNKYCVIYKKGKEQGFHKILADNEEQAAKVFAGRGLGLFCCQMAVLSVEEWDDAKVDEYRQRVTA